MHIAVLAGGVGGAKFLVGVKRHLGLPVDGPTPENGPHQIVAIVNTADDIRLHGLQICPDLDSCLYALAGQVEPERGWGRSGETHSASAELAAFGAEAPWFFLGDKDLATHLVRTRMLDAGYPLSTVTSALAARWQPGVTLLPMSDQRIETHVVIADPEHVGSDSAPLVAVHVQEWAIRYRAQPAPQSFSPIGASESSAAPGVLAALAQADLILIAPSNPVLSIGSILAVPEIREAVKSATAPVISVSPLRDGRPARGRTKACLKAIGVEGTAEAIGRHYGARSDSGLLDGYLVAAGDTAVVPGVLVADAPLMMTDPDAAAALVVCCRELAGV